MRLSDLATPCLILDSQKLENNISRMRKHLGHLGVNLRPHAKTSKSIEVIRLALDGQFGGITVSTLKEANYFFDHGIRDILYAVGIAPAKLDPIARLIKRGAEISLLLDTAEQARMVLEKAQTHDTTFPVFIEIDSDGSRSGIKPGDPLLIELGRLLHCEKGVRLKGILTHAGESYNCKTLDEIRSIAAMERDAVVRCCEALQKAGLPCPAVSVGSTPSAAFAENYSGVTEVRAGVYMFGDLFMAGLGVCRTDDIAISVLSSVIGHQRQKGWIIMDAGWTALSQDRRTAKQKIDQGYGLVCSAQGKPFDDLIVMDVYQEHGLIADRHGLSPDFDKFPIGSKVRILPNHACATGSMHDQYHVVRGEAEVQGCWDRIRGF